MSFRRTDPVNLLCDLSETSGDAFQAAELWDECGPLLRILADLGTVEPSAPLHTVTCRACYGDHSAAVDFDAATRRHFHFCPEAGFVPVDDGDLVTLRLNPGWLVEWLVVELPIVPPARRRTLVPGRVWHLGDARCGETLLTVVLARRVTSQLALDQLASALSTIPPADVGMVVTSSPDTARRVQLPHTYEFLDLREVARVAEDRLSLDRQKLGSWVKAIRSGAIRRVRSRSGRPSDEAEIDRLYKERRAKGLPIVNISEEARAIRTEFQAQFPDRDPPHLSTIRKHLPRATP